MTEAGDGEDGRIKSAIGIGSLLNDGVGDTIRVSLTEDSVHEIPVAKALANVGQASSLSPALGSENEPPVSFDPFSYRRRATSRIEVPSAVSAAEGQAGSLSYIGGEEVPRVAIRQAKFNQIAHKVKSLGDFQPDFVCENPASSKWTRATSAPSPS